MSDQQQVTQDVDRMLRLSDLLAAGILSDEERQFVEQLQAHRIGSVVESEVIVAPGGQPGVHSEHLTLTEAQRQRADAILAAYGG